MELDTALGLKIELIIGSQAAVVRDYSVQKYLVQKPHPLLVVVVCFVVTLAYASGSDVSLGRALGSLVANASAQNASAQNASAQNASVQLAQASGGKAQKALKVQDLRIGRKDANGDSPDAPSAKAVARVVLELNRVAPFRIFTLKNPERLIVDLPNADTRQLLPPAAYKQEPGTLVSAYRYGLFRPEILRFVFEFKQPISLLTHGTLAANKQRGFRIFIDTTSARDARLPPPSTNFASKGWKKYESALTPLWQKAAKTTAKATKKTSSKSTKARSEQTRQATRQAYSSSGKVKRVIIDAGHGGIDSGARANGLVEKKIVLAYAREIAKTLKASARYKVFLTRDGDFFIPLKQRYEIAQRLKADILISVHADYLKNKNVRGATIYTLSEVASDRESAELASRENNADVLVGQNLAEFTPDVSTILIDLARKSTNRKSWRAAKKFVTHMKKNIPTLRSAHRYAGFVVLKSPNIPSLLLEIGYMSNAKDVRNLKQSAFRKKVAGLVLMALDDYFKDS